MAESKEAMQNTIKNLQAKSDYIYKLEDKGSKTIVLQLGSHSIKMGFANEKAPFTVAPFVAYKRAQPVPDLQKSEEGFDDEWFKEQYHRVEETLKQEGVISPDNRPFKGKPRAKQVVGIERIPPHNAGSPALFGDEALRVEDNAGYIFRKVITHGALNVAGEWEEGERMGDLENLLVYLLKQKIKIPEKEWGSFNCILIVGDVFVRRHVKMLVGSLFKRIGFRKLYIHLESIMACFGTAVSSACVVDIGHEKISVCCVDEGVILPKTLIRKNFGSKDISKILAKIFNERISDPAIGQLHPSEADLFHLDRIKEIACAVREPEETINRIYEINPLRNGSEVALQIAYSDTICVASNSFFSEIWNAFDMPELRDPFNPYSRFYDLAEDPEDYFEEFSGGGHVLEVGAELAAIVGESICDPFIYQSLEDIVLASLLAIKDSDIRRKFTTSVLIIGGGAHMPKLSEEIMIKLNAKFEGLSGMDERAEMATDLPLREIAPIHASWLGGTVIPKLDSLRDLWIERGKFLGCLALDNEEEEENILDRKLFTRKEQSQ